MDRRSFLSAGSAAALVPILSAASASPALAALAPAAGSGDAALNAAFDKIFQQTLKDSPGFATSLGLDKGALAYLRKTFDPKPYDQALRESLAKDKASLAVLRAIDPESLSTGAALNREIGIYGLEQNLV